MTTNASGLEAPLITVLHVGAESDLLQRLRREGLGVVEAGSAARGLRLLRNFRVGAVICDVPDLSVVTCFVATGTPVILLAGDDAEWGGPEVTVVSRRTPAETLAAVVRRIAAAGHTDAPRRVA